ncbi:helix-turn-helix domain-containing protein [Bacillus solitudinis]|uniref:helix-turn-helix domain-containing protein n=1 Tax=Bacillus solitudinis TaxID=2014074 RepID=UPI000C2450FF|nr:AraC family transcriptional regulator [Bacillus solitudinis]
MNIGFCGYSFHTQRYHSSYKSGFPGYLFRLQTEGTCSIIVNSKKMNIEKGDLLLIKPGDYYEISIEADQNSGDYHLFCEGDWIKKWWSRSSKPTLSRIDLDEKLLALWRHLTIEERRPSSEGNKELSRYLLQALCLILERVVNETAPAFTRPYVVTRMMRYIEEHATLAFKVDDVANSVGLSVSRSVHLFKSCVGKTMIEYAQEIRISAALDRMTYTTMTLDQIAEECGFGTYPYFHKVFKKKYGISPGVYRRRE